MLSTVQKYFSHLSAKHIFLFFLFLGLFAYGNAVFHPFVHDDIVFIQNNPRIGNLDLKEIFLLTFTEESQLPLANAYYRPMIETAYRLQHKIFGLNPAGFHFVNILLHIFNAFLLHLLLKKIFPQREALSFLTPVFFLVHPVQSEAVASIAGISNLLVVCMSFLSFNFYLSAKAQNNKIFHYFFAFLFFALALTTKEQAAVLPVLILWYEYVHGLGKRTWSSSTMWALFGFAAVLLSYFFVRKEILGTALGSVLQFDGEMKLRLLAIPQTLLMYLGIIFFPVNLYYYRSVNILEPYTAALAALVLILVLIGCLLKCLSPSARKVFLLGAGWFFITLLPSMNIIPLVIEYSYILTMEHFLYLPVIGIIIAFLGVVIPWFESKQAQEVGMLIVVLFCIVSIAMTFKQNTYWGNEVALFKRTLEQGKPLGRVYQLLGKSLYQQKQYYQAIAANEKALMIMQGYLQKVTHVQARAVYLDFIKEIHFDAANYFQALGDHNNSLERYKYALKLAPRHSRLHNSIGVNYAYLNDVGKAKRHFQKAVDLDGKNILALNNLGIIHIKSGNKRQAEAVFKKILTIDQNFLPAKANLEKMLSEP